MPLKYKIVESKKLVYLKGIGSVAFSELMNHIDELSQDVKYKAPMKKLVDHRQIKKLDLTMKEQELFAEKKSLIQRVVFGRKMRNCFAYGFCICVSSGTCFNQ